MDVHGIYTFNQVEINTLTIKYVPWFLYDDICKALGIRDPLLAINKIDNEKTIVESLEINGKMIRHLLIDEHNFLELIRTSRSKAAAPLKKWIIAEVIPAMGRASRYRNRKSRPRPPVVVQDVFRTKLHRSWSRWMKAKVTRAVG